MKLQFVSLNVFYAPFFFLVKTNSQNNLEIAQVTKHLFQFPKHFQQPIIIIQVISSLLIVAFKNYVYSIDTFNNHFNYLFLF